NTTAPSSTAPSVGTSERVRAHVMITDTIAMIVTAPSTRLLASVISPSRMWTTGHLLVLSRICGLPPDAPVPEEKRSKGWVFFLLERGQSPASSPDGSTVVVVVAAEPPASRGFEVTTIGWLVVVVGTRRGSSVVGVSGLGSGSCDSEGTPAKSATSQRPAR